MMWTMTQMAMTDADHTIELTRDQETDEFAGFGGRKDDAGEEIIASLFIQKAYEPYHHDQFDRGSAGFMLNEAFAQQGENVSTLM